MADIHIFLDEKYADSLVPHALQLTFIAGSFLHSGQFIPFREKYFALMKRIFPECRPNRVPLLVSVHASELFKNEPRANDETRFEFMGVSSDLRRYRQNWDPDSGHESILGLSS